MIVTCVVVAALALVAGFVCGRVSAPEFEQEECEFDHDLCCLPYLLGHAVQECNGLQLHACGSGYCAEHHREKCKGECVPDEPTKEQK